MSEIDDIEEFNLTNKIKKKLKNKKVIKKELEEGKSAQEIMEISDDSMAKFYRAANLLLEHKRYEDASNAFLFLVSLNPFQYNYWVGLGMAAQFLHEYEAAIDAYELAAIYDIANPVPYFYLAKCLFAIHDRESALQALDLAIEISDDIVQYEEIKRQAIQARKMLLHAD